MIKSVYLVRSCLLKTVHYYCSSRKVAQRYANYLSKRFEGQDDSDFEVVREFLTTIFIYDD